MKTNRYAQMLALLVVAAGALSQAARAEPITIVAIGASNTVGRGGGSYPAELESMLRAKGYDAHVVNAGVNGDTTEGMAARLDSAVPAGTKLVLINPANKNDSKAGARAQQASAVAQMRSRLASRGIKAIVLPSFVSMVGSQHHIDSEHFDAEAYKMIAARLLPQVVAAIGPRR
jgi:acyl-CoA thioesterase-1